MQKTPRQLAKAFYHGELDWNQYRLMRRQAIDSLTGISSSAAADSEGGPSGTDGDNTVPRFGARPSTAKSVVKSFSTSRLLPTSVVILSVLLLLALLLYIK